MTPICGHHEQDFYKAPLDNPLITFRPRNHAAMLSGVVKLGSQDVVSGSKGPNIWIHASNGCLVSFLHFNLEALAFWALAAGEKSKNTIYCVLHVIFMRGDWFALIQCQFWGLLSSDPPQDHFHKEPSGHHLQQAFPHVISHGFVLRSSFRLKDTSAHWPQGSRVNHCWIHDYHPPWSRIR